MWPTVSESKGGKGLEHRGSRVHYLHPALSLILVHCAILNLMSLGRIDCHVCLLFCLIKWVCYMKLSSAHNTVLMLLALGVDDLLKHTAMDAAAPLEHPSG